MENKIKKRKINWIKITRRAVQAAGFLIMPGLFLSTFMAIKSVYVSLVSGTFSFAAQLPQILLLVAVIPATVLMGRFFCGYLCSFGALGDFIWFVSRKIFKKKIKIDEKTDRILKYFKYALLVFIVVFVWTLGVVAVNPDTNPWNVFGMYSSLSGWASLSGLFTVGGLILLLIIIGSAFVERFFCRYICPLGAVFAIVSKIKIFKIKKPSEECRSCKACTKECSMGIDIYKYDVVKSGECIDCMECIAACPRSNSQAFFAGKKASPIAVGIAVSAVIAGLYFGGKATMQSAYAVSAEPIYIAQPDEESGPYADGVYTGSADGYRGTTTVEVTIENGYISKIGVLSTDDDMEFFLPAQNAVVSGILKAQSPDVDAVTGATYSSDAIKNAVYDAMMKCSSEMDMCMPTAEPTQAPISQEELDSIQENPAFLELADGLYTGTGRGYNGEITADVTIKDRKITDISVFSNDDRPYFDNAMAVTDDVIAAQDVDVDTVSGATVSSNGILEAVADALGLQYARTPEAEGGGGGRQHRGGGGH